jgi:hypothetical protein
MQERGNGTWTREVALEVVGGSQIPNMSLLYKIICNDFGRKVSKT